VRSYTCLVRQHKGFLVLLAAAALAAVLLGCSTENDDEQRGEAAPNIIQPGAPGEPSRTLSEEDLADLEAATHTDADVRFMQMMIHHHAQALRMTSLAPKNGTRRDVRLLARRIELSQVSEIAQMEKWLYDRYEPIPEFHRAHGHAHGAGFDPDMPGMLTEETLEQLADARGEEFEALFLRSMIHHHEGALTMVRQLYELGGGIEPAADAFARHVEADQAIEIARMQELLAELR
jgi:uncharacterized protein (DUF305 family)